MFYMLSKILLFLLNPFWWVVILLIQGLFTKNQEHKKRLTIAITLILIIFTNPFLFNKSVNAWQPKKVNLTNKKYGVAILLSGMGGYDEQGNFYITTSGDRFIQTVELYHQGIVQKILISGGSGSLFNQRDEAWGIKNELLKAGIPDSAVLMESTSRNTYENAVFSKLLLHTAHLQPPYVLVTSAIHIPRAEKCFNKAKVPVIIYPCDYLVHHEGTSLMEFMPEARTFFLWEGFIKEIIGYAAYKITGKL
jgi:uncharacterized SAM-binding protein YcdF (DUF218 family)